MMHYGFKGLLCYPGEIFKGADLYRCLFYSLRGLEGLYDPIPDVPLSLSMKVLEALSLRKSRPE